eukprot:350169-Chlamydomonas_euryale.AAC.2
MPAAWTGPMPAAWIAYVPAAQGGVPGSQSTRVTVRSWACRLSSGRPLGASIARDLQPASRETFNQHRERPSTSIAKDLQTAA